MLRLNHGKNGHNFEIMSIYMTVKRKSSTFSTLYDHYAWTLEQNNLNNLNIFTEKCYIVTIFMYHVLEATF